MIQYKHRIPLLPYIEVQRITEDYGFAVVGRMARKTAGFHVLAVADYGRGFKSEKESRPALEAARKERKRGLDMARRGR